MRRLAFALLVLGACDAHPAGAVVEDAYYVRTDKKTIAADIDVRAASSSGRDIGQHCVSIHFFNPGSDLTFVYPAAGYGGEWEHVFQCFPGGLSDGDIRRVHLESTRTDLPPGIVVRAQVLAGGHIETEDSSVP